MRMADYHSNERSDTADWGCGAGLPPGDCKRCRHGLGTPRWNMSLRGLTAVRVSGSLVGPSRQHVGWVLARHVAHGAVVADHQHGLHRAHVAERRAAADGRRAGPHQLREVSRLEREPCARNKCDFIRGLH